MSKAVEWGYLKKNPAQGVKQLAVDEALPRYLNQVDFQALLRAEPDPDFRRLWELYLRTGCRRSELLQLTVEDINWQGRVILVKRTKGRRPKLVPITPAVEQLIRKVKVQVGKLFPWTPDYVTHRFKKWSRAAGLECRLHDLRHTYGSWLVQAGVEIKILKDLMGHRDVKTTEIYAHLKLEQLAKASEKIKVEKP